MPVTLHGRDQFRQKRNEPFATHIIYCAPGRDQCGLDRGSVSTDPAARFPSGPFAPQNVVQTEDVSRASDGTLSIQGTHPGFASSPVAPHSCCGPPFVEPILALPQKSCVSSLPTSVLIELGNIFNEAATLGSVTFLMSQCGREFRLSLIIGCAPGW